MNFILLCSFGYYLFTSEISECGELFDVVIFFIKVQNVFNYHLHNFSGIFSLLHVQFNENIKK